MGPRRLGICVLVVVMAEVGLLGVHSALAGTGGRSSAQGSPPGLFQEEAQLEPAGGGTSEQFGWTSAISADGSVAVAGAPFADPDGAAYVFTGSGGVWTQAAALTPPNGAASDLFGMSVAISPDGSTILVGAPWQGSTGAVYVYTEGDGGWSMQEELLASDGASGDWFGGSLALSSDGSTALIGAPSRSGETGAVYVFGQVDGSWTQGQVLTASDGRAMADFGETVSLSADGTAALVGAPYVNGNSAYVFDLASDVWSQVAEFHGPSGAFDFGQALAISPDASTALVSSTSAGQVGGVSVFAESSGAWRLQARLSASNESGGDEFGIADALSADGSTAVVGAAGHNHETGSAYVFARTGTSWSQAAEIKDPWQVSGDQFGSSLSMSADGNTILLGSVGYQAYSGAAYVFTDLGAVLAFNPPSVPIKTATQLQGAGFTPREKVDVSIPGIGSGTVPTNGYGQLHLWIWIYASIRPGRYTATATGEQSGLQAQAILTVTSA